MLSQAAAAAILSAKMKCEICETELFDKHCKLRCTNCGHFLDCSDIYLNNPKVKMPRIDMKELNKLKEQNFKERLEFIDKYAEWVKKTPNKVWSSQQKKLIDKPKR